MSEQMRHICLISGGKDSTALALYLKRTRPELPMEYLFCDTHKELEETYQYLARVEAALGTKIIRLNAMSDDRAFDFYWRLYGGYLPSANARWCTKQLKIKPFEDYVGDTPCCLYVGIRADEQREGYISTKPNLIPIFPFKEAGLKKADIFQILEESGVGIPEYYAWRSRSGCFFCFYQRRIEWVNLKERHPDLFEQAKAYEKPESGYTWAEGESLIELERPERMAQIREEEAKRRAFELKRKRKRPATLAQAFDPDSIDGDDEGGCLMCHL